MECSGIPDQVKVCVRVRPSTEDARGAECIRCTGNQVTVSNAGSFSFDNVFGPNASQQQLFSVVGKEVLANAFAGEGAILNFEKRC